jgi:uncharacterized protein YbcI
VGKIDHAASAVGRQHLDPRSADEPGPLARPDRTERKRMEALRPDPDDRTSAQSVGEGWPSIGPGGDKPVRGELNAAVARAVVRIHRDCVGRGPTKARAFFHDNVVVVVLEDVLVTVERTLLAAGRDDSVIRLRQEVLETMRPDLIAAVESLSMRNVTAMMGDTNLTPDMASLIFVLDRPIDIQPADPTGSWKDGPRK